MMKFDGKVRRQQNVNLSGNSRAVKSRDEIFKEAERARYKAQLMKARMFVKRSLHLKVALNTYKDGVRAEWMEHFWPIMVSGESLSPMELLKCVREFNFFAVVPKDVDLLVKTVNFVLGAVTRTNCAQILLADPEYRVRFLLQMAKLSIMCIKSKTVECFALPIHFARLDVDTATTFMALFVKKDMGKMLLKCMEPKMCMEARAGLADLIGVVLNFAMSGMATKEVLNGLICDFVVRIPPAFVDEAVSIVQNLVSQPPQNFDFVLKIVDEKTLSPMFMVFIDLFDKLALNVYEKQNLLTFSKVLVASNQITKDALKKVQEKPDIFVSFVSELSRFAYAFIEKRSVLKMFIAITRLTATFFALGNVFDKRQEEQILALFCEFPKFLHYMWGYLLFADDSDRKTNVLHDKSSPQFKTALAFLSVASYATMTGRYAKDIYTDPRFCSTEELPRIIRPLLHFLWLELRTTMHDKVKNPRSSALIKGVADFSVRLYDINILFNFVPENAWVASSIPMSLINQWAKHSDSEWEALLNVVPFAVPLYDRVAIFHRAMRHDRERSQHVTVYRNSVFDSAYAALKDVNLANTGLNVVFVDKFGHREQGIDAGGLTREFFNVFSTSLADPELNIFVEAKDNTFYPNRNADPELLRFAGKMVAKALAENVPCKTNFSSFFLLYIIRASGKVLNISNIDQMFVYDREVMQGLLDLKNQDNVADLGLTFTVTRKDKSGNIVEIELCGNGANIDVTNDNVDEYVEAFAKFCVETEFAAQAQAFCEGLFTIIPPECISLFSPAELLIALCGSENLDVTDWMIHTRYDNREAGPQVIEWFWEIVREEMSPKHLSLLLSFTTGASRPPIGGFACLKPHFSISVLPTSPESLPTSHTCGNNLVLPVYPSKDVLREKLFLAIESEAGFGFG